MVVNDAELPKDQLLTEMVPRNKLEVSMGKAVLIGGWKVGREIGKGAPGASGYWLEAPGVKTFYLTKGFFSNRVSSRPGPTERHMAGVSVRSSIHFT